MERMNLAGKSTATELNQPTSVSPHDLTLKANFDYSLWALISLDHYREFLKRLGVRGDGSAEQKLHLASLMEDSPSTYTQHATLLAPKYFSTLNEAQTLYEKSLTAYLRMVVPELVEQPSIAQKVVKLRVAYLANTHIYFREVENEFGENSEQARDVYVTLRSKFDRSAKAMIRSTNRILNSVNTYTLETSNKPLRITESDKNFCTWALAILRYHASDANIIPDRKEDQPTHYKKTLRQLFDSYDYLEPYIGTLAYGNFITAGTYLEKNYKQTVLEYTAKTSYGCGLTEAHLKENVELWVENTCQEFARSMETAGSNI